MTVRKDSEENGVAKYTINNGDLMALNRIKEEYNLKDSDDVIAFAIGVLNTAKGKAVSITEDDGRVRKLLPADQLTNTNEQ